MLRKPSVVCPTEPTDAALGQPRTAPPRPHSTLISDSSTVSGPRSPFFKLFTKWDKMLCATANNALGEEIRLNIVCCVGCWGRWQRAGAPSHGAEELTLVLPLAGKVLLPFASTAVIPCQNMGMFYIRF